jgi:hypothetical protein
LAWTISALSVYEVWDLSRHGGRWITPISVMTFEFGVLVVATTAVAVWWRKSNARGTEVPGGNGFNTKQRS